MTAHLILLLVSAATTTMAVHGSKTEDPAATAITNLCDIDFYLQQLEKEINAKLTMGTDTQQKLAQMAKNYRLASAAANNPEQTCLFRALLTKLTELYHQNEQEKRRAEEPIKNALAEIAEKRRNVAQAITLANLKLAIDTSTGHKRTSTSGNTVDSTLTPTLDTALHCDPRPAIQATTIGAHKPNPQNLINLPFVDENKITKMIRRHNVRLTFADSCNQNPAAAATFALAAASCTQASLTSLNPTVAPTTAVTLGQANLKETVTMYEDGDRSKACNEKNSGKTKKDNAKEYYADKVCHALKVTVKIQHAPVLDGPTLSADETIRRSAAGCLIQFQTLEDPNKSPENKALVAFLEAAYGKNTDDFSKKFKNSVEKKKVKVYTDRKLKEEEIENVQTGSEEQDALNRITGRKAAEQAAASNEGATTPETNQVKKREECNAEKDETKCINKEGCEFKEGECKVKVVTTTSTNTTGSNTFVLNKKPLLLVFLIL
uniref:Variant surface glycoprotein (VSG), putative n=1 Tax=Trypanosoma brucei brucei (strain 927/4 GUTat10.1) TaxID=185431 RepID=Q4FKI9_TRYB2|nr:variant surface glycoprotein (VSG), putative [Trypanosoma brucei brucei TREU927]